MDSIWHVVIGAVLAIAGLAYAGLSAFTSGAGNPDRGWLNGGGPILAGAVVAVVGILIAVL